MLRTVPRPVAAAASLLLATVFMVINPPLASAAPIIPTVGCESSPSLFSTGVDASGNGKLAAGSADRNWEMSQQYPRPTPVNAAPYPPANPAYASAIVGNAAPGAWVASPYGNAEWIGGTHSTVGDWYYRYQFTLDPVAIPSSLTLSLNFYADNSVVQIWVNDVAQSTKTSGLPQTTGDQYNYVGFQAGRGATTVLNNDWRSGANSIVVLVKSGPGAQGFNVQARPSVLCPTPGITVAQDAGPPVISTVGDVVTYTARVANTGNVELSAVSVAVSGFTGTGTAPTYSCPSATMAIGATQTCTATYIVRAGDLTRTSIAATATASGLGLGLTTRTASTPDTDSVRVYTPSVVYDRGATASVNTALTTVSGTSDATVGSPVTVTVGGQTLTTTVAAGGRWTVSPTSLTDATYTVNTRIVDTRTNAVGTGAQSLTVDTVAPVITVTGGPNAFAVSSTPTITGTTGEPVGTPVTVTVDGTAYPTTVTAGGVWSVTTARTADGSHTVVAAVTDLAGNRTTATQTLVIDTVAPAVTIDGGAAVSLPTGTFTLTGTTDAAAGSVVTVRIDDAVRTTTVVAGGRWSLAIDSLPDALHPVTVSVSDPAGNTGTATQDVTVDTRPPGLTVDGGPELLVNTATPTISGTTDEPAGTVVNVVVDGRTYPAVVAEGGVWSTPIAGTPDGSHPVSVSVADPAGNITRMTQNLVVDTVPDRIGLDGGELVHRTSATFLITGTSDAPVGTTITVEVNDTVRDTVVLTGGRWELPMVDLADGSYPVTATVSDPAGNVGVATQTIVVDTRAPILTIDGGPERLVSTATPTVTGTADVDRLTLIVDGTAYPVDVVDGIWTLTLPRTADGVHTLSSTLTDAAGNVTSVRQQLTVDTVAPTVELPAERSVRSPATPITGRSDAAVGTVVTVVIDGETLTGSVDAEGGWSVTSAVGRPDGSYPVVVTITDPAGNVGSAEQRLTIDTVPPTGTIVPPGLVATATPSFSGTTDLPVGTTFVIAVGGQRLTGTVAPDGVWAVAIPDGSPLSEGPHEVVITLVDLAGNTTLISDTVVVDTVAPVNPFRDGDAFLVAVSVPPIAGDGEPGSTITVSFAGQTLSAVVDDEGKWSVTPSAVADGVHEMVVVATDAAGNASTSTVRVTVDTTPPVLSVDGGASVTSASATATVGGVTDAPAGSVVTVRVAGYTLTAVVAADGTWAVAVPALANGSYPVTTTVTDAAGNMTETTQLLTVQVLSGGAGAPTGTGGGTSSAGSTGGSMSSGGTGTPAGSSSATPTGAALTYSGGALAYTGSEPAPALAAAGLLLLLGSGLVVASRRRRSGRTD